MKALFLLACLTFSGAYAADEPVIKSMTDKDLKWSPCPELFPKGCEMSVLHGDPSKPQADIYFKVPANYDIPAHSHTSPEHMTLISGNMDVKYKDEDKMNLKTGNYAYGPSKAPHEAHCNGPEACVLFISFDNPIDAFPYKGKL